MPSTLTTKLVVGRRVELALYNAPTTYRPGTITYVSPDNTSLEIRLDGKRYNTPTPADHEFLRILDEIVDVPSLPMGPFIPTAQDMLGIWADVPLATIGADGEDLILLTDDKDKAEAAAIAFAGETGLNLEAIDLEALQACWAVFTWEPEDAASPWTVNWAASEGDAMAVRIHYLPA